MQRLECARLFEGCPGVVEGETADEVLEKAAAHAAEAHGVRQLDPATIEAAKGAITTG